MSGDVANLIRSIYSAVLDDAQIDAIFAEIMAAVGASSGWINDFGSAGVTAVLASVNMNPETETPYRDHFFRNDPWALVRDDVSPDRAMSLERLVPTERFLKSEVYNRLIVPTQSDIAHCLVLRTDLAGRNRLVTFFRGRSGGEALLAASLLEGSTIEHHAQRGSALETVRKQLASLFRKCGVSRQAALVALLLTLPDSMPL